LRFRERRRSAERHDAGSSQAAERFRRRNPERETEYLRPEPKNCFYLLRKRIGRDRRKSRRRQIEFTVNVREEIENRRRIAIESVDKSTGEEIDVDRPIR